MPVLLGAIADDFTGATDLCNTLVRRGMRTVQLIGVPGVSTSVPDAEAVVVALKSRTIPAAEAIDDEPACSLLAARCRGAAGLVQILLDLRFDRRRQYRPGRRGDDGCARRRFHAVLPGFPGGGADDLPRLSVRRRRAAVGIGNARPPADADARPEPGAGAAAAEPRQGRAGAGRDGRPRRPGDPRRLRRIAGAGLSPRDRRCDRGPASRDDRRGRGRLPADHRRLRHCARPAREFPPPRASAAAARPTRCPPYPALRWSCRDRARPRPWRKSPTCASARKCSRSTRSPSPRAATWRRQPSTGPGRVSAPSRS